jgi:hypothetical protein
MLKLRAMKSSQKILLLVAVLISACSSEVLQSGEDGKLIPGQNPGLSSHNLPPVIQSARITPNPLALNQPISVKVDAVDPDGDLITYRHQWRINGQSIASQSHGTLSSSAIKRGDRLSVDVTPFDGTVEGLPIRVESTVGNALPEITQLILEPAEVRMGTSVKAEVIGTDADQDPIEYRFRWWRNNSEVADGDLHELDTAGFAKGDTIVVEVTPSDPTSKGKSKISKPIMILNSAPTITSAPPTKIDKGRFIYAVVANDPDGDPLTYALEVAPSGMKIDKGTGRIEWSLTGKLAGNHKVRVTATDDEQGKAFQEFDLTFSAPVSSSRLGSPKNFRLNTRLVSPFPALLE